MAYPKYAWNTMCVGATTYSGPFTPLLTEVKSLNYAIDRNAIADKSDWSWYPTIFSYDFEGFTWNLSLRNMEAAKLWSAQKFLLSATFEIYDAKGTADKVTTELKGLLIEDLSVAEAWGTIVEVSLSGSCSSIEENGVPIEGTLEVQGPDRANNYDVEKDTTNLWAPSGVL